MHATRRAFGHLVDIAPSLDDLPPLRSATEAAFLREPPAPGPSRPRREGGADAAVGKLVRVARRRIGITQDELACSLMMSVRLLRAWEAGDEPIPRSMLGSLAAALGLTADDLSTADHVTRDADERRFLAWFRGLPPEARASLIARLP